MAPEIPGWRKLSQTVSHHILSDIHGYELFTVMNGERMTYEFGRDHGSPTPGLDNLLLPGLVQLVHPALQLIVDKRAFLK